MYIFVCKYIYVPYFYVHTYIILCIVYMSIYLCANTYIYGYIFVCKYIYIHTCLMCARVYVYIQLTLTGWAIVPADFSTQRCIPNPTHKHTHAHNTNTRTRTHTFSRTSTHPHTPTHTYTRMHTHTHKLNRIFLYFHVSKNAQSALAKKTALDFLCKTRPVFLSLVCDMFMRVYIYIYIHIHILSIFLGTRLPNFCTSDSKYTDPIPEIPSPNLHTSPQILIS